MEGGKEGRDCLVKERHGNEKMKSNCFQVTKPSTETYESEVQSFSILC